MKVKSEQTRRFKHAEGFHCGALAAVFIDWRCYFLMPDGSMRRNVYISLSDAERHVTSGVWVEIPDELCEAKP
jgi:hypothetical protein